MRIPKLAVSGFRAAISIFVVFILPVVARAHSPHHVITDLVSTPGNNPDRAVFVLISDQLFRGDVGGGPWKNLVNGLDTQFVFTSLVVSPSYESDRTVFVSTAGDGVYRSIDGGQNWQSIVAGMGRQNIQTLFAPTSDADGLSVLAASANSGVWRFGTDGTWQMVLTEGVQITAFSEHLAENGGYIIYAGDKSGRVWRSDDGGRLWELKYEFSEENSLSSIAAGEDYVYVGTETNGLYRSKDGSRTFDRIDSLPSIRRHDCHGANLETPVSDSYITSVTVSRNGDGQRRIFVTTWYGGVFVSEDDGDSWAKWGNGLTCDEQADDMHQAHFRRLTIDQDKNGEPIYWVSAFDGLFRGTGQSPVWQQLETLPLGLIKGMAVTGGSDDLTVALATYGGGFYLTSDRGLSWTIGNRGLQTTRLTGLAFSPDYRRDGVIYGGASRRLLRSSDRGQSWQRIDLRITSFRRSLSNKLRAWGLPTGWLGHVDTSQVYPTIIVAAPKDTDKIWFATRFNGIMGYEHSTGSVVALWPETSENINTFEVSPDFENDRTMFASIRGAGAIRSDDGGNNWIAINEGLDFVGRWAGDPNGGNFRRDVVLAVSPNFSTDNTVYAGSPAGKGLFVSNDRGKSWTGINADRETLSAPVLAITLSPEFATDRTMMISLKGRGVFRSVDAGKTLTSIGKELRAANASIEQLSFSPGFSDDNSVIAASDECLFISEDGGDSWRILPRPVRYEDMRDVVRFTGNTERRESEAYSALTETFMSGAGTSARLRFVGNSIRWLGARGDSCVSANVYIDGNFIEPSSCASDKPKNMQILFQSDDLGYGPHEIEIRIESERAGSVGIDAFDILPAESPVR